MIRYDIYSDLGTFIKSTYDKKEAISWLVRGITDEFHFCFIVKTVKE